ncbi:MAG: type II toxin-antitoxin system Phd/YefM family antitoxin [Hyphomicrobiaceae bacterium]|jgi:prevent-host-death family protein|nr:type II toxin-antitoxin system Phd/YefM family antitoxin [Hyphomicrobiaceae bacterium]
MNILSRIPTTLSSREFNQNTSAAKRAAEKGPVFITDRGKPAHVLLTIEEYQRLKGKSMSLAEALEQKDAPDFDIELPEWPRNEPPRIPDLA